MNIEIKKKIIVDLDHEAYQYTVEINKKRKETITKNVIQRSSLLNKNF